MLSWGWLSPRLSDVPGSSSVRLSCHCCSNTNVPQLPFKFPVSFGRHFSILSRKEVSVCYSSLLSAWVTPQLVTPTPSLVTLSHWLLLDWDGFHVGISGCTVRSNGDLRSTPRWCQFRQEELVRVWQLLLCLALLSHPLGRILEPIPFSSSGGHPHAEPSLAGFLLFIRINQI